ncbi:MAG: tetratricopeptide repeat protein [Myxococcota bacterium]
MRIRRLLAIGIASWGIIFSVGCSSTPDPVTEPEDLITEKPATAPRPAQARSADVDEAMAAMTTRRYRDAADAWGRAIEQNPDNWELHMNHAIALSGAPDFNNAIAAIERAMDLGGEREWVVWFNLGNIYQNRGMYEEAIQAYRAGLSLHATPHYESLVNLCASYVFLNQYAEAQSTCNYAIDLAPNDPRAHHNLALIPQLRQKFEDAIAAYEGINDRFPDFAQSYYNKAEAHVALKQYASARRAFQRYIDLAPDGPYVKRAKNRLRGLVGRRDAAS